MTIIDTIWLENILSINPKLAFFRVYTESHLTWQVEQMFR